MISIILIIIIIIIIRTISMIPAMFLLSTCFRIIGPGLGWGGLRASDRRV